jgi:glycosyltransferase involved in cell wall biosynthesis
LQVVTDNDRRGAQVFATDLHEALEHAGYSVRTVALAAGQVGGLQHRVLGSTRLGPTTLRSLRDEVRAAAVVVAHGSSTLPACALATLGTGAPFVYRQISQSGFWASTTLRRARVRIGLARAALVVALWQGAADALRDGFSVSQTRIRLVPNGVPASRVVPPADRTAARAAFGLGTDDVVILYFGALVREKGVDLVVDAIGNVPGVRLIVVGDGPERSALEAQARSLGARVVFTGSLGDLRPAFAASDVNVLASRGGDSMPAALIEAGLAGLPSIATPVEAIPEIVVDGVTGCLVPVGAPRQLADALAALVDDSARRQRMGEAARAHCRQHFSIERVAEMWADVLTEVARTPLR